MIAYCVLSNHAHLLIYTEDIQEIAKFMRKVNTAYAIYYNKMEERVEYVFANRYYSQSIKDEMHLLKCILYIHQNPVKASLAQPQKEYEYSSYKIFSSNQLDIKMANLIFGTENYLPKFYDLDYENEKENEIIDVLEKGRDVSCEKTRLENLIENFCQEFKVNLSQIKKSNYLILRFKTYLNQNSKVTNKTICGILGI